MKLLLPRAASLAAAALLSLLPAPAARAQEPAFDVDALLDVIGGSGSGTTVQFLGGASAFLPERALDDGSRERRERTKDRVWVVIEKDGEEVIRWKCQVRPLLAVFHRVAPVGTPSASTLSEAGDYTIKALYDDEPIAAVPFAAKLVQSGDPFDPKTSLEVEAPMLRWGQLRFTNPGGDRRHVEVGLRLRGGEFELGPKERLDVEIREAGRVIYSCGQIGTGALRGHGRWIRFRQQVTFPRSQGGAAIQLSDFLKKDGDYQVVVRHGDDVLRAYGYRVEEGKAVPHARSAFDHRPRAEYLLPRVPTDLEGRGTLELTWMEPLDPASLASTGENAAAAMPAAATRARWKPVAVAPARAPELVVTDVAARVDAHLAAGKDIIAYGTGAVRGVAYLRCGEDREVTFEGGTDVSSKVFFVCGPRLVLVKNRQVLIHDTRSSVTREVPLEDVHLAKVPSEFTKGRTIDADGMLVAVLCDPTKTSDRRSVKVIDLSGDEPRIIALGLPDAEPSHLAAVAVDAAGGAVVVTSDRQKALFSAPIAADATFRRLDLSAHDGIPRDCAPVVRGGLAAVFDASGTRKLRLVDLDSGEVRTVAPLAKAERWFDFDGSTVALATSESNGGEYRVVRGPADGGTAPPAGSGDDVGSGKLGFGTRTTLAGDGLLFVSGSGKGGVGSSEFLHVTAGDAWTTVTRTGAPLHGVDVIAGEFLVAFKTGKARDARVGYVLLGEGTTPEMLAR